MYFLAVFVLLGTGLAVNCETYSLTYIYTAFSKPVGLPGIHEFTAMGLVNGRMIDYFDSDNRKKVPKQEWMKERLPAEYWKEGTQSRQSKQRWFKDSINRLKERMRQNDKDLHVLQRMVGCEGVMKDGQMEFRRGMDMHGYDGNDFLAFDITNSVWVAATAAAVLTERRWNNNQVLKEYTKHYLEKKCIDWLEKFINYGQKQLKEAIPPKVHLFTKKTKVEANIQLTCLATGFLSKDTTLDMRRNGRNLTPADGVVSSGVRPNGDDTFQRRDSVEILRSDVSKYTCEVIHQASNLHVEKKWYHEAETGSSGPLIGGAIAGVIVVVAVLLVLFKIANCKFENGGDSAKPPNVDEPLLKSGSRYSSDSGLARSDTSSNSSSDQQPNVDPSLGTNWGNDVKPITTAGATEPRLPGDSGPLEILF